MRVRRSIAIAPLLMGVAVALACSSESDLPVSADNSSSVAPSPDAPGSSVSGVPGLPPRPEVVSLVGIDPCSVLTDEQRAVLGFDRPPLPDVEPLEADAPTCSYNNSEASTGVRFIVSTETGIGVWLDGSRSGSVTPLTVVGFPALEIRVESLSPPLCEVALDVAEGQQLIAQNSPSYSEPAPVEDQCGAARMYAEAAMETLVAR